MIAMKNPYILEVRKNTYHIVLKRTTLRFHGAAACHFVVGIGKLIVIVGVRKLSYIGRP
jgi:ribosomal protein S2